MRFVIAIALAGGLVATAALAQQALPALTWDRTPGVEVFARNFPERAMHENQIGAAVLCCTVNADRTLNCRAPLEWPEGYGFGAATVAVSREFQLSEASYATVRDDPNYVVRRTVRWMIPDSTSVVSPEFTAAVPTACASSTVPTS